jgi:hypothetical protein
VLQQCRCSFSQQSSKRMCTVGPYYIIANWLYIILWAILVNVVIHYLRWPHTIVCKACCFLYYLVFGNIAPLYIFFRTWQITRVWRDINWARFMCCSSLLHSTFLTQKQLTRVILCLAQLDIHTVSRLLITMTTNGLLVVQIYISKPSQTENTFVETEQEHTAIINAWLMCMAKAAVMFHLIVDVPLVNYPQHKASL